ncbi:hypothetical protein [Dictyobacter aurantiacus]|uniref:Uncharacterized protein n=1 Tax=Dictyobacter aurantiacus TaxID=1936993 RepID=A0A401ZN54_9CHLR|nr:hypothetical protein [Dictyobacter aurantiacus]GCE08273.1 hypothetical protein KDAU_56020 [Dictyobacter aurantiacus]
MNNSPLPRGLSLTSKQAQHLMDYIQIYRRYAWENMEPTAERNVALRALQALHGRIMSSLEQYSQSITIMLPITPDERLAMTMMISYILDQYQGGAPTRERALVIAELTGLKSILDGDFFSR